MSTTYVVLVRILWYSVLRTTPYSVPLLHSLLGPNYEYNLRAHQACRLYLPCYIVPRFPMP